MEILRELWARDKAVVIVGVLALIAILYYIYKQNNSGQGTVSTPSTSQTPSVTSDQFSAILADLGALTPVTNSTTTQLAPITTTVTGTPITTTVTNSASVAQVVASGIGNDTARDAALAQAIAKYPNASQAAQLQAAIAAILKQYPRTGPTT